MPGTVSMETKETTGVHGQDAQFYHHRIYLPLLFDSVCAGSVSISEDVTSDGPTRKVCVHVAAQREGHFPSF